MSWVHFFILVLTTVYAKEEETNEITPHKPPINLDANLRRALLKALTELENEENEKNSRGNLAYLGLKDKIVEKASASALSLFASTANASLGTEKYSTIATTTEEITAKPIVVIQRSNGLQHRPITTVEKYIDPISDAEQILTSASTSFTSNKFSYSKAGNRNLNLLSNGIKTAKSRPSKIETTTVTTTTSTEESEAKVEDVQFFSAPLVAAFTVHQDERGLPKSVEPIYKNSHKVESKNVKEQNINHLSGKLDPQQEQLRTQLALQEKQKALEAEILRLKQQQQQQNYLIRQQQIFHEHQLQLQKQKLLEEQTRLRNNQQPFVPIVNTNFNQQTTPRNEFNNNSKIKGSVVSFQPSVSFTSNQQHSDLPLNAQQLPFKNPIDFRTPFTTTTNTNFQQLNYLTQQQPPLVNSVSKFNLIPTIQPQLILTAPKHNRVFRQESNTGNPFSNGLNNFNNYNQVSTQHQNFNNNRYFRSNPELSATPYQFNRIQPPVVNQRLNNLLYNSGIIRGRQQEDLNIVSKVLALNHYGGDFRFSSSDINEQRVQAPLIKKV